MLKKFLFSRKSLNTSSEEMHFMTKNGRAFLNHIKIGLFMTNNESNNFEISYLTLRLLIDLSNKKFIRDFIQFGFNVQQLALLHHDKSNFSFASQCNVHKFVCAYFLLLSKSSGLEDFEKYASNVCNLRRHRELFK